MIKKLVVLVAILTLVTACTTAPQQRESLKDKSSVQVTFGAVQLPTGISPINK
jgi:hypothetical protein